MAIYYAKDATRLAKRIEYCEPDVTTEVKKKWFKDEWYVRVLRGDGSERDYQDEYHYWLERALVGTFSKE